MARSAPSLAILLSCVLCALASPACGVELAGGIPNSGEEPAAEPSDEDPDPGSPEGTPKPDAGKKPTPPPTPTPTPTPAACDLAKPFGVPKQVPDLSQGGIADDVVRFYLGETRAVLTRDMGSSYDLYEATTSGAGGTFGAPGLITKLSETSYDDNFASISENGLFTVFATKRFGGPGGWDIFASSRTTLTAPWSTPVPVPNANSWGQDWYPYLASSGDRLYFASDRNGAFAIYEAQITFGATITATNATEMTALSSSNAQVQHPVVSADGLRIYFSRGTLSSRDVWTASRAKKTDPFSGATKLAELSTNSDEYPTWVSLDGCRLFLSGYYGSASRDIFMAEKPK